MIKGKRVYKNFEDAKEYVLARREEMRRASENEAFPDGGKTGICLIAWDWARPESKALAHGFACFAANSRGPGRL